MNGSRWSPKRIRAARIIAIAADLLQVAAFPLFLGGASSPINDVVDILVSIVLVGILGWNWVFLPTLITELVPALDLFPTWTAAVLFVTRPGARPGGGERRTIDLREGPRVRGERS